MDFFSTIAKVTLIHSTILFHEIGPPTIGSIYPLKVAAPLSFQTSAVCNAYSPNQFELTWIKVHGNFTKFVTVYEDNEGFADNKYKKTSHLKFEELSHEDVGRYLCVAKNIAGQVSREVDVYIQGNRSLKAFYTGKKLLLIVFEFYKYHL